LSQSRRGPLISNDRHAKANPKQRRTGLLVNPGKRCANVGTMSGP
jgi:hypothetical protein